MAQRRSNSGRAGKRTSRARRRTVLLNKQRRNIAHITPDALTRFHASYRVDEKTGCWVWTAQIIRAGYGNFNFMKRKFFAHRVSWELHNGPIRDGLWVLHKCDNPPCCNPAHLFLGTNKDNIRDAMAKGRMRWVGASLPGETNPMAKLTEAKVRKIKASTAPQRHVAEKYGISPALVKKIRDGRLWPHIPIPKDRAPIKDGRKTLCEEDVRQIRASTEIQRVLAKRFGVCRTIISHIRSGKLWKHVT